MSGEKKVGHAGTLDPLAQGVLLVLTGSDTKKQSELMGLSKEYVATFGFNILSDSYDLEFEPVYSVDNLITLEDLKANKEFIEKNFVGEINQVVPVFSAVKVNGKRLYKSARKGNYSLDKLPSRLINIYRFEILEFYTTVIHTNLDDKEIPCLKALITCSSGTYIRAIARDLGNFLKTQCVMLDLIRTKVGDFDISNGVSVEELKL